jgi:hypothetical protein
MIPHQGLVRTVCEASIVHLTDPSPSKVRTHSRTLDHIEAEAFNPHLQQKPCRTCQSGSVATMQVVARV